MGARETGFRGAGVGNKEETRKSGTVSLSPKTYIQVDLVPSLEAGQRHALRRQHLGGEGDVKVAHPKR